VLTASHHFLWESETLSDFSLSVLGVKSWLFRIKVTTDPKEVTYVRIAGLTNQSMKCFFEWLIDGNH